MKKIRTMIQSIDRAAEILEIVRSANGPIRAKNIADTMGLSINTTHNLIRSLYQHGFLVQDTNRCYLLGGVFLKFGGSVRERFEHFGLAAREPIRQLCKETGNTAFVGTEYYGTLYCVARAYPDGYWEINGQQKWLNNIHAAATGKIIIAEHGEKWFADLLKRVTLEKFTEHTLTTPEEMNPQIAEIRKKGYALCVNESGIGTASLAIAIRERDGRLLGAVSESFPDYFLESDRFDLEMELKKLRNAASGILSHF